MAVDLCLSCPYIRQVKRIGRYQIEREIGRGAMGVVYLAHDPRVGRPVALKTIRLPAGLTAAQEREHHERFLREAQSAGRLDHPAIVTIYDADEDSAQSVSFIAMEYVPGRSLREVLQDDGDLPMDTLFFMVARLAEALAVAHAAGVVHRDVKPANILVREGDGAVKIADFGIARLSTSELTQTGQSLGSPAYMSPEQIRGRGVDGRSDLFSLAVILYEALAGERPFAGDDLSALAYAVVHETPVPMTRRRPELPVGLDGFFDRALAKDPAERFEDGAAFKVALEAAARTVPRCQQMGDIEATCVATPVEVSSPPVLAAAGRPERDQPRLDIASSPASRPPGGMPAGPGHRRRGPQMVARATILVVAVLLAGWFMVTLTARSTLVLDVKNSLESGRLVVRVDGESVYTHELSAERRTVRAFGKKLMEWGQETFQTEISVRPGERSIEVEVIAGDEQSGERELLAMDFEAGTSRTLKIVAGRKRGDALSVRIQ